MNAIEAIDAALADLESMKLVACGAAHERKDVKYDAFTCPLRHAGNMACCHPLYDGSAAQRIRKHLSTVLRIERETGVDAIAEYHVRDIFDAACEELISLDLFLATMHARMRLTDVVNSPENEQTEHGRRIDVVRQEVMEALLFLRGEIVHSMEPGIPLAPAAVEE